MHGLPCSALIQWLGAWSCLNFDNSPRRPQPLLEADGARVEEVAGKGVKRELGFICKKRKEDFLVCLFVFLLWSSLSCRDLNNETSYKPRYISLIFNTDICFHLCPFMFYNFYFFLHSYTLPWFPLPICLFSGLCSFLFYTFSSLITFTSFVVYFVHFGKFSMTMEYFISKNK